MKQKIDNTEKGALLSNDKLHRILLWRIWDTEKPVVMFVGLNPSIADHTKDDATIRRMRGFAERMGFGGFYVANLFTLISTKPNALTVAGALLNSTDYRTDLPKPNKGASKVIFCWGDGGGVAFNGRDKEVIELFTCNDFVSEAAKEAFCFGKTAAGNPRHPLYLPYTQTFIPFNHK